MSICFQCGVEIPAGEDGVEYKWCSIECKQKFHDDNFGDHILTKEQTLLAEKELEEDNFKDLIDEINEGKSLQTKRNGFFEKKKDEEEEKLGFFERIWGKTIFPDKIKAKKEEKALRRELEREAKMEALKEIGPELKKAYKKKELDKLLGKKESGKFWSKLGEELASTGRNVNAGKFGMSGSSASLGGGTTAGPSTDKLMAALGKAPNVNPIAGLNQGVKQDRISKILRTRKQKGLQYQEFHFGILLFIFLYI